MLHDTNNPANPISVSYKKTRVQVFDYIYLIISMLIFISSFLTLAFLISVNHKGFSVADEGYYLLSSQFPNDVEIWATLAHIYTGLMFQLVGNNIIALRILSEIILFVSALIFFLGLSQLVSFVYSNVKFKYNLNVRLISCSIMSLGALFYYVHFVITPSYNYLNAVALYLATGFVCFSLASISENPTKQNLAMIFSFVAGLFIGICLLAKFPTAISLILLFSFVYLVWPQVHKGIRFLNICMLLLGLGTWIIIHVTFLQSWASLWSTMNKGIYVLDCFGEHKPILRLHCYLSDITSLIINAFTLFWKIYLVFLIGLIVVAYKTIKKNKISEVNLGQFFMALFILTGLNSITLNFYKGGTVNSISLMEIYTAWLLLIIFSTAFTLIYQENFNIFKMNIVAKRMLTIFILLLMLPFAGAGGTANQLSINMTEYLAAWFGLILLLMLFLTYAYENRWIFLIGSFMITAFACSQIISAGYIAPYNLNKTIQYQTESTAIGFPPTYLELDKETHSFFEQLNLIAKSHGFQSGDDIIAPGLMPGLVYALGGKSPVSPWYFGTKKINEWILQQASLTRVKNAFILQNENSKGMPDFSKLGIQFPTDYVLCGQVIWPVTGEWVRLWRPKASY